MTVSLLVASEFDRLPWVVNVISGPCDFAQGDGGDVAQGDARMGTQKLRLLCSSQEVGATGFEPATSSSRTMRATKLRHAPRQES